MDDTERELRVSPTQSPGDGHVDEEAHRPSAADEGAPERSELTVSTQYVPRQSGDVFEMDMEDGFILFNHESSLVHHLNPSAAIIWQLCDGTAPVSVLARDIAEEFGLDPDTTVHQVSAVVAEFEALGLVEDAGDVRPTP